MALMRSPEELARPDTVLLQLARRSIEHGLVHREPLPVDCDAVPAELRELAATFTTLRIDRDLRGCCGTLVAQRPLAEDVASSAFKAAFHDTRFRPVREAELGVIRLEVAVLSSPEPIQVTGEDDLLARLVPGEDGLVIIDGMRRATFLPKVWEQLPEPRRFVAALKKKCGLREDYWSNGLAFQRYRTSTYREA